MELIWNDSELALKNIAENSIDLVVTSPPYDGYRKYNTGNLRFWTIEKFCAISN